MPSAFLFSLFFPFSGGEAAGINPKLTDILHVCLNTGYAIPLIERRVIQHLEVIQFSILIQKLLFLFNVMEAYTAFAISAVECDFQHVFVFADNLSTGCSNIALGENWLFIPFAEWLQNFKLFDEALCQEVNR